MSNITNAICNDMFFDMACIFFPGIVKRIVLFLITPDDVSQTNDNFQRRDFSRTLENLGSESSFSYHCHKVVGHAVTPSATSVEFYLAQRCAAGVKYLSLTDSAFNFLKQGLEFLICLHHHQKSFPTNAHGTVRNPRHRPYIRLLHPPVPVKQLQRIKGDCPLLLPLQLIR
jgi:hypothetical protein